MRSVTGADAAHQSRGCILSPCCFPLPVATPQNPLTDAEPLPSLVAFSSSPRAPGWGDWESQGALPATHSPSRLVSIPRMLFPDVAGLLGQQEGRDGQHAAAPCCLLTRLPVLPAAVSWFLRKQPSGRASSRRHPESPTQITTSPPSHQECECSCWNHPVQAVFHGQVSGEATAELSGAGFEAGKTGMTLLCLPFSQMLSQR